MAGQISTDIDRRFMAAAIRFSRRNLGSTGTNPSVATIIVRDSGNGREIIGRGVTAIGGRPHAETIALSDAGDRSAGATAYVTLEPCAHHGRTPPCAEALVKAGISRVVGGASDPDPRVSGQGYAILRDAGIEVVENVLADEAGDEMSGYLSRSSRGHPFVTLKLAVSCDGKLGSKGAGQVPITGSVSRNQVHIMRAQSDAILVGVGTVLEDDPDLRCRLDGARERSPHRVVLDSRASMPSEAAMLKTAATVPVTVAIGPDANPEKVKTLRAAGAEMLSCEIVGGSIALPELLDDLAARGVQNLMIEGGAAVAGSFLDEGLVDRIALFSGPGVIGSEGVSSPLDGATLPDGFAQTAEAKYGDDRFVEWTKIG